MHFMLVSNRQLYTKGLFYGCVERCERRCIRSENGRRIFFLLCTRLLSIQEINLVEPVSAVESYLGSRFTVAVQNCRMWSTRPHQQWWEFISVFICGVCHALPRFLCCEHFSCFEVNNFIIPITKQVGKKIFGKSSLIFKGLDNRCT